MQVCTLALGSQPARIRRARNLTWNVDKENITQGRFTVAASWESLVSRFHVANQIIKIFDTDALAFRVKKLWDIDASSYFHDTYEGKIEEQLVLELQEMCL